MSNNIFIPEAQKATAQSETNTQKKAIYTFINIPKFLLIAAQVLTIGLIGLLPILFIPGIANTLAFDKFIITTFAVGGILVLTSLLFIFTPKIQTVVPKSYVFFFGFLVWGILSAFVAGDMYDSFYGRQFESQTIGFVIVMFFALLIPLLLQRSPKMLSRAFALIGLTMVFILAHLISRLFIGSSFLDFNELGSNTQSLLGDFNDVAIYAGLVLTVSLLILFTLPLRLIAQSFVGVIMLLALSVLAIINFQTIWFFVAFVGLVLLIYGFLRKPLFGIVAEGTTKTKLFTKASQIIVTCIALGFVFFGQTLSGNISSVTNTNFVEVRPSATASLSITRAVFEDNLWFGVGPNRYADAWRLHKNDSINETIFWDTDFNSGHSLVLSIFTTFGLVGGILFVLFTISFAVSISRRLLAGTEENPFNKFIAVLVFISALYLWVMTYVYTPGVSLLLLTAFLTGMSYVTAGALNKKGTNVSFVLINNKAKAVGAIAILVVVVVCVSLFLVTVSNKYHSEQNIRTGTNIIELAKTYEDDELYLANGIQYTATLEQLLQNPEPSEAQQEEFLQTSQAALESFRKAIELDETNPNHHLQLAKLYLLLTISGVNEARDSALASYENAMLFDPKNPKYHLLLAQLALTIDDRDLAKKELESALVLKKNYTDAIQLQSEIAIADNDIEEAIDKVTSIVRLEPANPSRYLQLGLLYESNNDTELATAAYKRAVELNTNYADARYLLALQYIKQNLVDEALVELEKILVLNPGNIQLQSLIEQISDSSFSSEEPADLIEVDIDALIDVPSDSGSGVVVPVNVTPDSEI